MMMLGLILYITLCGLYIVLVLGCMLGIWCEFEEEEYGRVVGLVILLLFLVLAWLLVTDMMFEMGWFEGVFEWLRSEV